MRSLATVYFNRKVQLEIHSLVRKVSSPHNYCNSNDIYEDIARFISSLNRSVEAVACSLYNEARELDK